MAAPKMVQCIHCKYGKFMQWMKNPIICECTLTDERYVAEAKRLCSTYEHTNAEAQITHYKNYDDEIG